jgi:hypothetical protein
MKAWFDRWFLRHPRSLGLTYGAHARGSLRLAGDFGALMVKAVVHAAVPGLFATASTDGIERALPDRLASMKASQSRSS